MLPSSQYGGKEVGGWVCHAVGVVGLMASLNFSGAYDNSVSVDGDQVEGNGVWPDNRLLQYLCRDRIHTAKVGYTTNYSIRYFVTILTLPYYCCDKQAYT